MAVIGDTAEVQFYCSDSAGADLSLTKATFDAKYTLTWRRNGASITAPTYTVTDIGEGMHAIRWTVAAGVTTVVPSEIGTDLIEPALAKTGDVQSYDFDALGGLFATTGGSSVAATFADESLGQVVENDSFRSAVLTIDSAKLTRFGYTDLDDLDSTITAGAKKTESDSEVPLTVTKVDAAARTIQITWDTFPAGLARTNTNGNPETWYIDVQGTVTASSQTITLARYSLDVIWERDT